MSNKKLIITILPLLLLAFSGCNKKPDNNNGGGLTIDIYASNDFHGAVEANGKSIGLAKYGTFMKQKGQEPNTLLLDQGDTWQGSIYSNYNYGALINDVMCEAKFDARTVGNHDFDWGIDALVANTKREYNNYKIPVLAANVYDYDFVTKTEGTVQQSDIGGKSVTYTLENGLKVGIVGTIGKDQITSITSSYVQDVCFINHVKVIKEEATKLRKDGCDVVIASVHAGQDAVLGNGLDKYVDLVLCGHSHQYERSHENDLYYAQFGANGQYIGHVQLTYNQKQKKVTNTSIESFDYNDLSKIVTSVDSNISNLINKYSEECDKDANQVVASNASYFSKGEQSPNLMTKAMMDKVEELYGDEVILSYCNTARAYLPAGEWTYANLYSAFPFDNTIYIASIKGEDIINEVCNYSNVCFSSTFDYRINPDQYYKIATIDHLLYHTNTERYYNYFPSFTGETIAALDQNYRVLLKEWLIDNGYNEGKRLEGDEFSSNVNRHNANLVQIG